MTLQEFEYIRKAMAEVESGDHTDLTRYKLLRTVSQITGRAADKIQADTIERVDMNMARNYQDLQNRKLVDLLSQ